MTRFMIDRFSTLDHLPVSLKGDALQEAILAILRVTPRYSVFEVKAEPRLAHAVAALQRTGRIRPKESAYPWHEVEVLDTGRTEP